MAKVQIKSEKLTPFGGIFLGYRPGVYVIGDRIVYIENSDGNTNVRFYQATIFIVSSLRFVATRSVAYLCISECSSTLI